MNSSTGMVETRPSPDGPRNSGAEASVPTRPPVARSALADRLALRLGMALVIWSRQHAARQDARRVNRVVVVASRAESEDRRARQFAADRRAMAGMPRR